MQGSPVPLMWLLLCLGWPVCVKGGQLSGVLRDNQGSGITGITVTVYGSTQLVATTDSAGGFSFPIDSGEVWIDVAADQLNARGYFSVGSRFLTLSNQSALRITTRKLGFTEKITGRVVDEAGNPLAGETLRASILENDAQYETNVVLDARGAFTFAATPAAWSLSLDSAWHRVLGQRLVEAEPNNSITQAGTFVAPRSTTTISVTISNSNVPENGFYIWELSASTEAFGTNYSLVQCIYSDPGAGFDVFNGIWTISATARGVDGELYPTGLTPVTVAVTNNGWVPVVLIGSGNTDSNQLLRVHTVTTSGMLLSNVQVYATSPESSVFFYSGLAAASGMPGAYDLELAPGRWSITGWTESYDWGISREVTLVSGVPPPELTLIFPEEDSGPRIFGTVRNSVGAIPPPTRLQLYMSQDGTNYATDSLVTDVSGYFERHVIPGLWTVVPSGGLCVQSSVVLVSNDDVEVDPEIALPDLGPPARVTVNATYDDGTPLPDGWFQFQSGPDYRETNGLASFEMFLRPGMWLSSLESFIDPYTLVPSFATRISPGAETNLLFVSRLGSSRIAGRLSDEQNHLILNGSAAAWTSINGTNFRAYSPIASGYFSLNVFPGEWQVGASVSDPLIVVGSGVDFILVDDGNPNAPHPTNHYATPPRRWLHVSNELVRCDFVVTNIPLQPRVKLVVSACREDGTKLRGVDIFVTGQNNNGWETVTGDEGSSSLAVAPGQLDFAAFGLLNYSFERPGDEALLWPEVSLDISAPSNQVLLIARQPSTCFSGTIVDTSGLGLLPQVYANADLNGTNYSTGTCTDASGHYCAPAIPGNWRVSIFDVWLNDFGVQSGTPRDVTVPSAGPPPSVDFVLSPFAGDYRTARLLSPVRLASGAYELELDGQASLVWRFESSDNLIDWTPFALKTAVNGKVAIQTPATGSWPATFYRAVWVQ